MTQVAHDQRVAAANDFWNRTLAGTFESENPPEDVSRAIKAAADFFGDVRGKRLLDLGCGNGFTSLFFAGLGAEVYAVDASEIGINNLRSSCKNAEIKNVYPVVHDARYLSDLGQFDYVFGSLILHHIEPFDAFCSSLRLALKPGGKAFFHENNAASDLLLWFRKHVVGRFWVPKYGDPDEFPLTPSEVATLRRHFNVRVDYPDMVFFQLIAVYILKNRLRRTFKALDMLAHRSAALRKYSYRQDLFIEHRSGGASAKPSHH